MRRVASGLIVTLLFLGLFAFAFRIQPARAQSGGTIVINPDGNITPSTANITTTGNVTYTFTGNNYLPIVVNRSNIIINGRGYTLKAPGNTGFFLEEVSNVSIEVTAITNCEAGIMLLSSSGDSLSGNNLTAIGLVGVEIVSSSGNFLSDNRVTANSTGGYAIWLVGSEYNTLSGNNVTDAAFGIDLESSYNNTLSGNVVAANKADGISLGGSGNVLSGNIMSNSVNGIALSGNNNTLSGNVVTANYNGIWVISGSGNVLSGNNVTASINDNIEIYGSGNVLSGNNVTRAEGDGIYLAQFSGNILSGNTVTSNANDGIYLGSSDNNTLSGNNVTENYYGIYSLQSSGNVLSGNNIAANNASGIWLSAYSYGDALYDNNVTANVVGVYVQPDSSSNGSLNRIFHNNFLNNTEQANVPNSTTTIKWDDGYPSGGNYWSNYNGTDLYSGPYQNITGSDGIGDTPYTINVNNTDHYPLMHPWSSLPVHDINTGLGYATIQEALDAPQTLNGHTIFIDEGIYYENIVIYKAITLVGANQRGTIIDGKGEGNVIQIKADNVDLMNLSIRNAGRSWGPPPGKGYPDSCISASYIVNASVENCILSDAAVCAWFVYSSSVRVTDCIVSNATYMGLVGYASSNTTFQDNLVACCGAVGLHFDGGSTDCKMVNNTVTNSLEGIEVERSAGNFVEGNQLVNNNASIWINNCIGLNVFRNNNMTSDEYNLIVWGGSLESFEQNIDTSNTANSKTVYYITNSHDLLLDPSDCPNPGYLAIVNCSSATVTDIDLSNSRDGLLIAQSTNCTFMNITISGNRGPLLWGGLTLFDSSGNSMIDSGISNSSVGVCLYQSSGNIFYHNSFIEISNPVIANYQSPSSLASGSDSINAWDNGYPSGGNYWSDYQTRYPNATETDNSGMWNTPYVIDANNTDRYPLMAPFRSFNVTWDRQAYSIGTVSNSTLSNFSFNATTKTLSLDFTGANGTVGFCRIAIPLSLMSCANLNDWIVTVNGTQIPPPNLNVTTDANYTYIYFTYHHSTELVQIISTSAAPEFQPYMLMPLFMIITLFGAMVFKRKRVRRVERD